MTVRHGDGLQRNRFKKVKRYRLLRGVEARLALLLGQIFWGNWCKPQRDDMIIHIQSWMSDCASAIQSAYRGRASRKIYNRIMAKLRRKAMYKKCVGWWHVVTAVLAPELWARRDQCNLRTHRRIAMAVRIQCFFRVRKAKRLMLDKMKEVVQKFVDQNTGLPYWYNPRSGKTSWHKPKLLQEEDVEEAVAVAEPDVECVEWALALAAGAMTHPGTGRCSAGM